MRISDWSSDVCSSDLIRRWQEGRSSEMDADHRRKEGQICSDYLSCQEGACAVAGASGSGTASRCRTQAQGSRSEEHTSELQSLMRISYAVFCLKKKKNTKTTKLVHIKNINK